MATTYDKASLVMIPSGYKDQKLFSIKPTDGSGDFTFSRDGSGASPATRVNASGLIEKGRTNELTYSNDFGGADWTAVSASITTGQSGYDGSSDASLLTATASGANIYQLNSTTGVLAFSVYAKAGTAGWVRLRLDNTSSTDVNTWVNLSDGSIGSDNGIATNVDNIGGGWYRITSQVNTTDLNNVRIYPADSDGNNSSSGNIYIQDAQLESGLIATDVIETTTTAVSAGLLGDMPRLDYSGGASCPSLLLEPSRTNIVDQSEYIASWLDVNSTQESNYSTSPEGVQNATRVVMDSATGEHSVYDSLSVTSGTQYTQSIFLKQGDGSANWRYFQFRFRSGGFGGLYGVVVDLQEGTIGYDIGLDDYGIENYGNGWYRIWITATATTTSSNAGPVVAFNELADAYDVSIVGDTNADVLVYGSQWEAGSYPTSYIPTYGSASLRGADNGYKALPDSILGTDYNEGTLFFEAELNQEAITRAVSIESAFWTTSSVRIECTPSTGLFACDIVNASVGATGTSITLSPLSKGDTIKCALAWNNGSFVFYANGQSTSGSCPVITTKIYNLYLNRLGTFSGVGNYASNDFKQVLVFPSALTNAELASLTTI